MTPSSSISNTTDRPPIRKSDERREKKLYSEDEAIFSPYSSPDASSLSGYWGKTRTHFLFFPCPKYALKCRFSLESKIKKCTFLFKKFIQCIFNNSSFEISSSLKLLLTTAYILEKQTFPFIFLSLCNSKFAKKLIMEEQKMKNTTIKRCKKEEIELSFSLLISSLLHTVQYIQKSTFLGEELEEKNSHDDCAIIKSFFATLDLVFNTENTMANNTSEDLISIIRSSSSPLADVKSCIAQDLILESALNNIFLDMQKIADEICLCFINDLLPILTNGKEILYFINTKVETNISPICKIMNLKIWQNLIFCSISRVFLKEPPTKRYTKTADIIKHLKLHSPNLFSKTTRVCKTRLQLIKSMLYELLPIGKNINKHEKLHPSGQFNSKSSIAIACNDLTSSVRLLNQLLNILFTRIDRKSLLSQKPKSVQEIKEMICLNFTTSYLKEILHFAINEFDSSASSITAVKETLINSNAQVQCEEYNLPIPERRSTKRSKRKQPLLTDQSTIIKPAKKICSSESIHTKAKKLEDEFFSDISDIMSIPNECFFHSNEDQKETSPSNGSTAPINTSSLDLPTAIANVDISSAHIDWNVFFPKIEEIECSIESFFSIILNILQLCELEYTNMSTTDALNTAINIAFIETTSEENDNRFFIIENTPAINAIIKICHALDVFPFIKSVYLTFSPIVKEEELKNKNVLQSSIDLINFAYIFHNSFKDLLLMFKEQAKFLISNQIEISEQLIQFNSIFLQMSMNLIINPTNDPRKNAIIQIAIDTLLQCDYEV